MKCAAGLEGSETEDGEMYLDVWMGNRYLTNNGDIILLDNGGVEVSEECSHVPM
jgi:hypothetical protein